MTGMHKVGTTIPARTYTAKAIRDRGVLIYLTPIFITQIL